jgi:hypothetical protein
MTFDQLDASGEAGGGDARAGASTRETRKERQRGSW